MRDGNGHLLTDPCDFTHCARVAALAGALAGRLGWDTARRARVRLGAILHDVGKLAVSETLLAKPGRLTDEELLEVRRHPAAGALLVSVVDRLQGAVPCILYHHERWDGGGYPSGRAHTEIPIEARLLAVADAFDAMISDRPYRRAMSETSALEELDRGAGSQFDPWLAEAFIEAWWAGAFGAAPEAGPTALPTPRASSVFA